MLNASGDINYSLNAQCIDIEQSHGINVSRQGLSERFNDRSVQYIKAVLRSLLIDCNVKIGEGWLNLFNRIRIKDSTRFVLPDKYKEEMPAFGGTSSKAGACIQYEFDIKSGSILDLNITPANRPDSADTKETKDNIAPNDLVLRDLGYFSIDVIKNFIDKGAFLISKLNVKTFVYEKKNGNYIKLDFARLYKWMLKNKIDRDDRLVFIGSETKLPMRVIIELVSNDIYVKRIQKIKEYNKRKGHTTTDDYVNRSRFNIIITNIAQELVPSSGIVAIYHVRWQVELVFKIWKSTFMINKTSNVNYTRWLCLLYAKLVLIIIYWQIIMVHRSCLFKIKGKLISMDKSFKTMKANTKKFRLAIQKGGKTLDDFFLWAGKTLSQNHWLENRKKRVNFDKIIDLMFCKSN